MKLRGSFEVLEVWSISRRRGN